MIENRILGFVECYDNRSDTLEVLESIVFGEKMLDLKSINHKMQTHILLDREKAKELGELLLLWSNGDL